MDNQIAEQSILGRFRNAVDERLGARVERIVLFGSRARGDFRDDSDYDVAVFLRDMGDLWDELGPLADITTDILIDTGAVISAKPFRAGAYNDASPLMRDIQRDGRDL